MYNKEDENFEKIVMAGLVKNRAEQSQCGVNNRKIGGNRKTIVLIVGILLAVTMVGIVLYWSHGSNSYFTTGIETTTDGISTSKSILTSTQLAATFQQSKEPSTTIEMDSAVNLVL